MSRLVTLALLLACMPLQARTLSPIHVRHTHIDNLSYELDCLAGLVRCTRDQLPLADYIDPVDIERWRETARTAQPVQDPGALALPTASDLRDVSSRHREGAAPGRALPPPARRALIDKLLRRTSRPWQRELAPELARQRIGLETAASRIELETLLPQIAALFGQSSDDLPPVSLIAIDGARSGSLATLGQRVAYVETPLADTAESRLPVIVHEFVHHWQEGMTEVQRRELIDAFLSAPGNCAITAYHFFDEAVASAIGNGIVESRLLGPEAFASYEALPESYYADFRVDRIAKALRTRMKQQLVDGGMLGAPFVRDYVRIAGEALGNECGRLDSTLHTVGFILTSPEFGPAQRLAQDRLAPATAFIDVVTADDMRTAAKRHAALPIVAVATPDTLSRLSNWVPPAALKRVRQRAAEEARLVHALPRDGGSTAYIVVGDTPDAAAATLLQLVLLRREAFSGEWRPPPLPGSVPD
ncbi:MAG: hypothetical protein AAF229_09985 [Pseudomonadota bacterium]